MEKYWTAIKNSKFLGGSFFVALGSLIAGILNYFFHLAIGRMVDVQTYGEVVSIISVFQLVSFPAGVLGIIAAWYSAKDKADGNFHQTYESLKFFSIKLLKFGVPILIILLLVTPLVSNFLKIENRWALDLVWMATLSSMFFGWASGIINGLQKFKESSCVNIFGALVKLIVGLILVRIGLGAVGVSASFLFSTVFSFLMFFLIIKFLAKKANDINFRKSIREGKIKIITYAKFAFFSFLLLNVSGNVDMILAKHNLNTEEAGYYGALLVAAKVIIFITGAIATVFFAMSSEDSHKNKKNDKLFWQSIGLTGLACFLFSFFYFLFPEFILKLFFGQTYISRASLLIWFALMASSFSLVNIIFFYFLSKEHFKELIAISIIPIMEIAFLYFFGHNIFSIVLIATIAQCILFLVGLLIILFKKTE